MSNAACDMWQRKLDLLLVEEAKAVDASVKFKIREDIDEARAKLEELRGEPARSDLSPVVSPTKLRHSARTLFGRDDALARLDNIWRDERTNVVVIQAWGGVGKTSLVAEWMTRLASDAQPWHGARRVFDWTFYGQGTRAEERSDAETSSEWFIAEALKFFDDPDPTLGSPRDRGVRLAELVGASRSLLVLDGFEVLQHPPGPLAGQITDQALEALVRGLAQKNAGLCVITTRVPVWDLAGFFGKTAVEWPLEKLTGEAGAELLHSLGVTRAGDKQSIAPDDSELRDVVREVDGHALTLHLMGTYLKKALNGDVRRRDVFDFPSAERRFKISPSVAGQTYGQAFSVMSVYETWLPQNSADGAVELAILRLIGLFDRPASAACLEQLRAEPVIAGLTEPLVGLSEEDWNIAVSQLEEVGLLKRKPAGATYSLDAHPLVREFFAWRLKTNFDDSPEQSRASVDVSLANSTGSTSGSLLASNSHGTDRDGHVGEAFVAAQCRLYEYLCRTTEYRPSTLADLQPLYQAVVHGCLAGLHERACNEVYWDRIEHGGGRGGNYSSFTLGANSANLSAVRCFFQKPWSQLSPNLCPKSKAWILSETAFSLRALGRLTEAIEPMRASLALAIEQQDWSLAAVRAKNLSELELTMGSISEAIAVARNAIDLADRSAVLFWRKIARYVLADALIQSAVPHLPEFTHRSFQITLETKPESVTDLFEQAQQLQIMLEPDHPQLYSVGGFRYADFQLAEAERTAWRVFLSDHSLMLGGASSVGKSRAIETMSDLKPHSSELALCHAVSELAMEILPWVISQDDPLDRALANLGLSLANLYSMIFAAPLQLSSASVERQRCGERLDATIDDFRLAVRSDHLPRGLLARSWFRFLVGDEKGCRSDLDEAREIAERGAMRLFQADIQLTRARLFRDRESLAAARQLIEDTGYKRRLPELADATVALADAR